jgi:NAD(P)H-dependent FMN reductase
MTSLSRVLGVSGSLRTGSVNSIFLDAMALIAPDDIEFRIYHELGSLPLFNPDLLDNPPGVVKRWMEELARADMLLLVSPEYAHGVTGAIKNALDWIVGSGELVGKRLAFPNLSTRTNLAQNQLAETLHLMGCQHSEACSPCSSFERPLMLPAMNAHSLINDPRTAPQLNEQWANIVSFIRAEMSASGEQERNVRYIW